MATLVNGVGESVLYTCLEKQRRINSNGSEADHLKEAARQLVPANVPGSPAYHRAKLHDLLAIVDQHGIPSLFLTLTADETSHLAWPEVEALAQKARDLTGVADLTWRDMPCEMARLFSDRVQAFMQ